MGRAEAGDGEAGHHGEVGVRQQQLVRLGGGGRVAEGVGGLADRDHRRPSSGWSTAGRPARGRGARPAPPVPTPRRRRSRRATPSRRRTPCTARRRWGRRRGRGPAAAPRRPGPPASGWRRAGRRTTRGRRHRRRRCRSRSSARPAPRRRRGRHRASPAWRRSRPRRRPARRTGSPQALAELLQRPAGPPVAGEEQVDRAPGQAHQAVDHASGRRGDGDQLVGQVGAELGVLRAEHAVVGERQRLGQRDRVAQRPDGLQFGEDRRRVAGGVRLLGRQPDAQAVGGDAARGRRRPAPGAAARPPVLVRGRCGARAPRCRRDPARRRPAPSASSVRSACSAPSQNAALASAKRPASSSVRPVTPSSPADTRATLPTPDPLGHRILPATVRYVPAAGRRFVSRATRR